MTVFRFLGHLWIFFETNKLVWSFSLILILIHIVNRWATPPGPSSPLPLSPPCQTNLPQFPSLLLFFLRQDVLLSLGHSAELSQFLLVVEQPLLHPVQVDLQHFLQLAWHTKTRFLSTRGGTIRLTEEPVQRENREKLLYTEGGIGNLSGERRKVLLYLTHITFYN